LVTATLKECTPRCVLVSFMPFWRRACAMTKEEQ
jgi:hypothetical protein